MHTSCRSRKMLKNEHLLGKIGIDTTENEPEAQIQNINDISYLFYLPALRRHVHGVGHEQAGPHDRLDLGEAHARRRLQRLDRALQRGDCLYLF